MSVSISSTSSFVTEVLQNAGRLEKEDLHVKLGSLSKKTSELKTEVHDSLQKKYVDFYPNLMTAVDLNTRVQNLSTEMQNVASRVEKDIQAQLNISATEFQDLSTQLAESNAVLHVLGRLVKIDDAFRSFEESLETNNFREAAEHLAAVHTVLSTCEGPRDNEIKILRSLREKHDIEHAKLVSDVAKAWVDTIKWDILKDDAEKKKSDSPFRVTLCVTHKENHKEFTTNVLQAMQDLGILSQKMQHFSDRFLKSVVESILTCSDFQMKIDISEKSSILSLTGKCNKVEVIPPDECFKQLSMAINFLNDNIFSTEVGISESGKVKTTPLLCLLGSFIDKALVELIITKCLSFSIPSNSSQLEKYREVIQNTEGFQNYLQTLGFLKNDNTTLLDYVNDVNVLFANKKCQEILEKARALMTSDIHSMVKITPTPTDQLPPMGLEGTSSKRSKVDSNPFGSETLLSSNTFQLPACYLSESAEELMRLAYSTLHEATTGEGTDQCRVQLFYSVRNMFMLFSDVVPTYHKESLENLPQITALHHNNCMYLAHHLLTLGHQFRPKLPKPLCDGAATFVDLVPKLRRLGTEAFLRQMSKQRDTVLDYLASAQGFVSVSEGESYLVAEKSIKQLLHQIQRLSNLWHEVLPASVYYKSIGTLLNSGLVEMMSKITSLDDISADDATQLHALMAIIRDRAPAFYEVQTNDTKQQNVKILLHTHIRKWNKFIELMWILNAGLQEISDRWADGKGPLAAEFQANEVKQLIRAIFQNTDKRSKILSTIK